MEFLVTYEAGVYRFVVRSTDPDVEYEEEFELVDLGEVRQTVHELVEEIARPDEDFEGGTWGDDEEF